MIEDESKKVVSIVNGKPVTEKPEIDPYIVSTLEELLQQAYSGNIDQLLVITMNDAAVAGSRIIAGQSVTPEVVFTQIELMKDDYKDEFIRPLAFYSYDESDE